MDSSDNEAPSSGHTIGEFCSRICSTINKAFAAPSISDDKRHTQYV